MLPPTNGDEEIRNLKIVRIWRSVKRTILAGAGLTADVRDIYTDVFEDFDSRFKPALIQVMNTRGGDYQAYYDALIQFDEVLVFLVNRITNALLQLDKHTNANVRMTALRQATDQMVDWLTNQIDNAVYDLAEQNKENTPPQDNLPPT